jgi:hypothetical protein
MAEYGAFALATQETVRQVVMAYAEGRIELDAPAKGGARADQTRYAPSFLQGEDLLRHGVAGAYTAVTSTLEGPPGGRPPCSRIKQRRRANTA